MKDGRVILVGAGPGDPALITFRGADALLMADIVVYDRLAAREFLDYIPAGAERIDVGKTPGKPGITQEEINRILIEKAREGKTVVRLKGGDPFVFGRGGEEVLALLEAKVPFHVVPGVTAGVAAPACAGIPVTHRGKASCVTFVTGHEDPDKPVTDVNYEALAKTGGTLVFYMGVKRLPEICSTLMKAGLPGDTPAACIERGTTPLQRSIRGTLSDIAARAAEADIQPPAVTVIGHVAGLPEELDWFSRRPLHGKRVVVTRPVHQALGMSWELGLQGAQVISFPTVEIVDPPSWRDVDEAVMRLDTYDWIVFTSVNAVNAFDERMFKRNRGFWDAPDLKIAVIGRATADALKNVEPPDLVPEDFTTEGLLKAFRERHDLMGKRVLLPRSSIAREELREGLAELGAEVTDVPVYTTRTSTQSDPEVVEALARGECDIVTFTSSSTVQGFVEIVGREAVEAISGSVTFASIGPVTSRAARDLGVPITIEAEEHTTDGLVKAILDSVTPA
ncbi:MAG TPA: uroporphyrinogen-III C-methyltransferase [Planctomycetota bacterium]|nr:uroporphyrinogen-III C-methyltransferase [Planctomycetota bacterium]